MAKRGMKQSFCSGHLRHETKADAKAHAANMARRGVARGVVPGCERCPDCGGWHVLHRPIGATPCEPSAAEGARRGR